MRHNLKKEVYYHRKIHRDVTEGEKYNTTLLLKRLSSFFSSSSSSSVYNFFAMRKPVAKCKTESEKELIQS